MEPLASVLWIRMVDVESYISSQRRIKPTKIMGIATRVESPLRCQHHLWNWKMDLQWLLICFTLLQADHLKSSVWRLVQLCLAVCSWSSSSVLILHVDLPFYCDWQGWLSTAEVLCSDSACLIFSKWFPLCYMQTIVFVLDYLEDC